MARFRPRVLFTFVAEYARHRLRGGRLELTEFNLTAHDLIK